jgi:hypothetical protein
MIVTYPGYNMGALMEFHFEALREYREENTALFYLVLSTVDMTGTRHETDIAYIERHFHNGAQRDGQSFLKWLHKFGNHSDTGAQDRLQVALAQATLTKHGANITTLEKHCVDILSLWTKVEGNSITSPASFNARLLSSIPADSTGIVGSLRSWFADKITDGASFLMEPETLIDKLIAHARTLGMPETGTTGGNIYTLRSENKCDYCNFNACTAGKDKEACLVFNVKKPIPATCSSGSRSYVATCRAYVTEFKPTSLKNVPTSDIYAKVKELPKKEVQEKKVSEDSVTLISDSDAFEKWWKEANQAPRVSVIGQDVDEFNKWWQEMNIKPFVTVVGSAVEEGGLTTDPPAPEEGGRVRSALPFTGACVNMLTPLRASRAAVGELRSRDRAPLSFPSLASAVAQPFPLTEQPPVLTLRSTLRLTILAHLQDLRAWLYSLDYVPRFLTVIGLLKSIQLLFKSRGPLLRAVVARCGHLRLFLLQLARGIFNRISVTGSRLSFLASTASRALASP